MTPVKVVEVIGDHHLVTLDLTLFILRVNFRFSNKTSIFDPGSVRAENFTFRHGLTHGVKLTFGEKHKISKRKVSVLQVLVLSFLLPRIWKFVVPNNPRDLCTRFILIDLRSIILQIFVNKKSFE